MKFTSIVSTAAATFTLSLACVLPAQAAGTWETTLLGRDINLNAVAATDASAVYLYDTTLKVTWLRDANAGAGSSYDNGFFTNDGLMTWGNANTWADNLVTGSGGNTISNWRLPTWTDTGTPGCNWSYGGTDCGFNPDTSTSEMASLFYNTLGNKADYNTSGADQAGYRLTNTAGSFQNMQFATHWLSFAWAFGTSNGGQFGGKTADEFTQFYALAVRPGDVSPAPEPETYLMLLLGLGVVGAISRRRSRVVGPLAL